MKEGVDSCASVMKALATMGEIAAAYVNKTATYQRRADEWIMQHNLAARELMQIGRQLIGSLIAEQIAYHEYLNIQKQIEQSQEVDQFLRDKFSNEQLYAWMQGELSRLYYEYYRFSFDIARKAEQTMKHELMRPELDDMNYIKFNYWDKGRRGLLSGESLHLDLKRMEMAYHDHNKREYELTKHITLRQLDPIALLRLKAYGTCEVSLPEWLFDLDSPGHYMRRIKNVSLTIPAVTGSFTNVHCTLSLLKSTLRRSPLLMEGEYRRATDEDDTRFADYYGTIQSIVSSNAQNDSGMFETNLRDERFLPFEGHGAISTWRVELPADYRQFDYNTISDIILHLRYTARQGVDQSKVKAALDGLFQQADTAGLSLLFSLRYDFSTEWSGFVNGTSDFTTKIRRNHFPYFAQSRTIIIDKLEFYDGNDLSNHETVTCEDATSGLADKNKQAFTLTAGESQVLTTTADAQIFLIIRYSLS